MPGLAAGPLPPALVDAMQAPSAFGTTLLKVVRTSLITWLGVAVPILSSTADAVARPVAN